MKSKQCIERGFHEKELKKTIKQLAKMDRNELLRDRIREGKDPQTILVDSISNLALSHRF